VTAALETLAHEHGLPPIPVRRGKPTGFRHRARLAVRGRANSPKIGIFAEGSHRIVDIPRCLIHHPLINRVAAELRRAMVATRAAPYSDDAHQGFVRYLQVVVERSSQTAQVVVVFNDDDVARARPLLDRLEEGLGDDLHSLFFNGNRGRTNTILGDTWVQIRGRDPVEERVGGARVFYEPGAFGQSHLDLADSIVEEVHDWVPPGAAVVEFYAGVGAIGLGLARRGHRVTFNEVSPQSLGALNLGRVALGPELGALTSVVEGTAGEAAALARNAEVVIVDPPRKGLDPELREALAAAPPERLAYVACGLPAFLNDAALLTGQGALTLSEVVAYDLFPYTEHVELVARFDRDLNARRGSA
jgi:tRNA/tmRNA/rRNA uracil-C5-methylase (TrmA/RlmC/RlmD family)